VNLTGALPSATLPAATGAAGSASAKPAPGGGEAMGSRPTDVFGDLLAAQGGLQDADTAGGMPPSPISPALDS